MSGSSKKTKTMNDVQTVDSEGGWPRDEIIDFIKLYVELRQIAEFESSTNESKATYLAEELKKRFNVDRPASKLATKVHSLRNKLNTWIKKGATDPEEFHLLKRMFQPDVSDEKEELKQRIASLECEVEKSRKAQEKAEKFAFHLKQENQNLRSKLMANKPNEKPNAPNMQNNTTVEVLRFLAAFDVDKFLAQESIILELHQQKARTFAAETKVNDATKLQERSEKTIQELILQVENYKASVAAAEKRHSNFSSLQPSSSRTEKYVFPEYDESNVVKHHQLQCPKCKLQFDLLKPLQIHVEICIAEDFDKSM